VLLQEQEEQAAEDKVLRTIQDLSNLQWRVVKIKAVAVVALVVPLRVEYLKRVVKEW
jgi:hypothetical protein